MQINEKLTQAARDGAQGKARNAFARMSDAEQSKLVHHLLGKPALVEEMMRTVLLAMPADDLDEVLQEMKDEGHWQNSHP